MTDAELIEQVVQEVVRRLRALSPKDRARFENLAKSHRTLTIDQRVISIAVLEGQLDGVKKVVVQPKAIVTPAVRDELRDRDIQLVRSEV